MTVNDRFLGLLEYRLVRDKELLKKVFYINYCH